MMGALVVLALVAVAGALVAGAVVLARSSKAEYAEANQVVPGRPTRAPASWAGSHDPEARLHRRLRDAMAALRANQAFDDDGSLLDVRVELEEQALLLDDDLVAVAALPSHARQGPLSQIGDAVGMIESAVADLASRSAVEAGPRLQEALRRIRDRTSLVDDIRSELENLPEVAPQAPSATGEAAAPEAPTPSASAPAAPAPPPDQGSDRGQQGQTGQTGQAF